MQGNSSENLNIRSSTTGTQAKISLSPSASSIDRDVDVKDSYAGTTPADQTLVGRGNSMVPAANNTNWDFGNITITWTGEHLRNGMIPPIGTRALVPAAGDTVTFPGSLTHEP